jgi:SAM-dependent methyltransferase
MQRLPPGSPYGRHGLHARIQIVPDLPSGFGQTYPVNENHKKCGSDEWRSVVRHAILPWALGDIDLGDDVLEVGPGYGATTDVLSERLPRLTAVEVDQELAAMLRERFAGSATVTIVAGDATALDFPDSRFSGAACFTMLHHVATQELQDRLFSEVLRVLRPGGVLVAGDSLGSPELAAAHEGDTYNPIETDHVSDRLASVGFQDVEVKSNEFGWTALARRA